MGRSCRTRSHLSNQNQNTFTTGKFGGSLSQSVVCTQLLTPRSWRTTTQAHAPLEVNWHRVLLPPVGGNGVDLGCLPKNLKKVNDRGWKQRFVIERRNFFFFRFFGENLRQMAFTNSFYFVSDRLYTVDGGLLQPTGGVKTTTSKDPFSRCEICKNLSCRLSER